MAIDITVPEVGESVSEVYIGRWHKSEGERVNADEDLVEIESDKATFDVPASTAGTLTRILKAAGETATVGEVIGQLEATAGTEQQPAVGEEKPAAVAAQPAAEQGRAQRPNTAAPSQRSTQELQPPQTRPAALRPKSTPEDQPQPEAAPPSLPIPREKARSAPTAAGREEQIIPMSPIRRRIAERLVAAQHTAALLTTFNEIDMSAVMSVRERVQDSFQKKHQVKLGIMSFFVKALIRALQEFPQLNAEIRDHSIVYRNYYDIGIAIGSSRGLLVPGLHDAQRLTFADIERAIRDYAQRAESDELRPDELRGGTFTISNGGVYGSLLSTPIVNPPQSGVLGLHAIQDRPVVVDKQIVVRPMMYVALTYDHRIVDGREAVTCLARIKTAIEDPLRLLIGV